MPGNRQATKSRSLQSGFFVSGSPSYIGADHVTGCYEPGVS